jgi:hypothetical protein
MQAISNLVACTFKTQVSQRAPAPIRVNPKTENPLVRLSELSSPGHDAAPVDKHGQTKRAAILKAQYFRAQFGTAVKRYGRFGGKQFAHALIADAGFGYLGKSGCKGPIALANWQRAQPAQRVNPACAQKDQSAPMTLAEFQQVHCAKKVMLHHLAAAGSGTHPGKHAWIRCRINDPVRSRHVFQITGHSNVAMEQTRIVTLH